jgi:hypothetical protein
LRKVDLQPLIDKIGARLPEWQGKLLSSAWRETLVKTVLTSQPIYHLTGIASLNVTSLWRVGNIPNHFLCNILSYLVITPFTR